MQYGKIIIDDSSEILFEIEGPYIGEVSDDGIIEGLNQSFSSVLNLIKKIAENTYEGLQDITEKAKPDEFQVSFGIKLSGEAGVVFAKAGSEGAFQIALKWKAKK